MSDVEHKATTSQLPKKGFWRRFALRQFETRTGKPHSWGRLFQIYDAQLYGLIVALGVPLMGWLITDWYLQGWRPTFDLAGYAVKVTIAAIWFAFSHVYWSTEMDETADQVEANSLLNVRQSDYQ